MSSKDFLGWKMKKVFIFILMMVSLIGCDGRREIAREQEAEDVAVSFFDAIYNQKDLKKAATFCSPGFADELNKYLTARNAARRLFNMTYDTVQIETGLGDTSVRREFTSSGELVVLFTGKRDGKTYKELKKIKLIKRDENWYVDKIMKDPVSG